MFLADSSACDGDHAGPINSLCRVVADHGNDAAAVALVRVVWPLFVLALVLLASRIALALVTGALERTGADAQVRTLVKNIIVFGGWIVGVFSGLYAVGIDLNVFLTVGGLGTLVIGLAFQDLLRNVLAGIFLLLERPFRIGDVVTVDNLTGSVVTIQLRTTALRLPDGHLAIIPNLSAFSGTVVNLTAFERRRFSVNLWVPVGTDLERLLPELRAQLEATTEIAGDPPPRILPTVDIDGGVTLQCQFWLEYRDHEPDAVQAVLVRRLYAAAERVAGRDVGSPAAEEEASPEPEAAGEGTAGVPAPRRRRLRIPKVTPPD